MLDGILQTWKRHDFFAAAKYAACRIIQRLMVLDITHFMIQDIDALPSVDSNTEGGCRFLSADEVREFANDPNCDLDPSIANRILGGNDYCFGCIVRGQLACYCWLALHSIEAENNRSSANPLSGIAISFPAEFAFRYKGYTHPHFRGRRLYQQVAREAAMAMREFGVKQIISSAEWVNFSALKSSYRSGFKYAGLLTVAVVAGKRVVWHPDLAEQGIVFDSQANVLDRNPVTRADVTEQAPNGPLAEGVLS